MKSSKDPLREFVESVRGKDCSEVIILADREATRAYRNSLCSCDGFRHSSCDWCQYCNNLTRMIHFLRNEAKPKDRDIYPYNLFYSLQNGTEQENKEFLKTYRTKPNIV
jgi:hypothetical protein